MKCPKCGNGLFKGQLWCQKCGCNVSNANIAPEAKPEKAPVKAKETKNKKAKEKK